MTDETESTILTFPDGLPGLRTETAFQLWAKHEESVFQLLESQDTDGLAFVVVNPWLFYPTYAPNIDEQSCNRLDLTSPAEAVLLAIVKFDGETRQAWANLQAPIVINARTQKGMQVILEDGSWPLAAPLPVQW